MNEIPGFEGLYSMSDDGKIWSLPKKWDRAHGGPSSHKGKWLKPILGANGYEYVTLIDRTRTPRKFILHRLIAITLLLGTLQVNHKNGIKNDNRVENLEWMTPSQNAYHAKQVLLVGHAKGEKSGHAKLTDEKVRAIRLAYSLGTSQKELAVQFSMHNSGICRIVNRQIWEHVK